ncbi:MAG: hypothetical protein ACI4TT_01490 [Christensenellales bacterium]
MVNSKKMSKSSIAVIVLSILLVLSMILGLTGAWFTDKDNAGNEDATLTIGNIGSVSVTATDYVWHRLGSETQLDPVNDKVMPGDYLKAGSVTIDVTAGDEDVWYLIKGANGKFYKMGEGALVELAEPAAQSEGLADVTVEGAFVKLGDIALDGTVSGSGTISDSLLMGTTVTVAGDGYTIAIIQKTNVSDSLALTQLQALLA